ncbi:type II toxin-antitoxin system RelE/ParE family toxin [Candidatus Sumerlaeota bacterium]|nr:type II toxin-antitoxin system RelE/ParE family toxin [Candidatus Sumerlaeota bacterium]
MKVFWTDTAKAHLRSIHHYIALDSLEYARQMIVRLTDRSIQISAFPKSGRKVPEFDAEDVREVIEGPYRIVYLLKADQIEVLAVIHCRQDALREQGGG